MIGLNKEDFLEIIKRIGMGKTSSQFLVKEAVLNFDKEGMHSFQEGYGGQVVGYNFVDKSFFSLYKPDTDVLVLPIADIYKPVKEFLQSGRINIKTDNEAGIVKITDTEGNELEFQLTEIAEASALEDNFEFEGNIMKYKDDKIIIKGRLPIVAISVLSKVLTKKSKDEFIEILFKDNMLTLTFSQGGIKYRKKVAVEIEEGSEETIRGLYASPVIKSILTVLSGELIISVSEIGVLHLGKETDTYKVHYIVNPSA